MANASGDDVFDEATGPYDPDAIDSILFDMGDVNPTFESEAEAAVYVPIAGCAGIALIVLFFALVGVAMFIQLSDDGFSFTAAGSDDVDVTESQPPGGDGSPGGPPPTDALEFVPASGIWNIENLPFLPACGPSSGGSSFQTGSLEVLDDGASILATGSRPGSVSIELSLVHAESGRLVYVGVESMTGLEMTMAFSSPDEMAASVAHRGELCFERPARGDWDRELGAPDPDPPMHLPLWLPDRFPFDTGEDVDTDETGSTKTVSFVVEDRHPTDVLFDFATWAEEEGHSATLASQTTLDIQLLDGRSMHVEVVDLGNFNTQLTVTVVEA